jgi:hypothetical protein
VRICEYNKRRKELGIKISSGILTGSRCSSKNCKWEDDGGDDDSRDCNFVVRESRSDLGRRVEVEGVSQIHFVFSLIISIYILYCIVFVGYEGQGGVVGKLHLNYMYREHIMMMN